MSAAAGEAVGFDRDRVGSYLRDRLAADSLEVTKLKRNVGGMSRETWFVEVSGTRGGAPFTDSLTIRVDHPEGSVVPVSLEREYRVFAALTPTEVPVAEALWYETDGSLIGRAPFYVRRTVPGSASAGRLFAPGNEETRRRIGRHLAERLAAVHTLDWRAAGLGDFMAVPQRPEDCALLELAHYEEAYRAADPEPMPVVEALFSWLKRNVPTEVERVCLVWGDVGVGNFIYDEDRVVALTDWEQAHLGDPMKDWASALWRGADALLPREEMFEAYEKAGGPRIDEERIRYYSVFIDAEYVCTSFPLLSEFGPDRVRDATFARLGMGVPYMCMDHGLRTIGY
ncbi:phosphotransferase family protein [Thermobifida halotolerans]|uniref:Phosphotransferase family protein n=1 Tax=Thermobifida halotolerans TaxID=483545 RepID=A0A399G4Y0_9ACTN|nr:phosphotransferase family protein [Thermobifida halotolerans]UOE21218.1 phosphotransferase family protein [Thermobifida halotolerans]